MSTDTYQRRSLRGTLGQWITVEEARKKSMGGMEWWKKEDGRRRIDVVELKQHDASGPADKPIWCWKDNESMYLGGWKQNGPNGYPVRHGLGLFYWNRDSYTSRLSFGVWKDDVLLGFGLGLKSLTNLVAPGRWISLKEAEDLSVGVGTWWSEPGVDGAVVEARQYVEEGPSDKPVWYSKRTGSMYLGEWKKERSKYCQCIKHGYGIYYDHKEGARGRVVVGTWRNNMLHGFARVTFQKSSPIWTTNRHLTSVIRQTVEDEGSIGVPFEYRGRFVNNNAHDTHAVATLKDGTSREGPWEDGRPVQNWLDHKLAKAVTHSEKYPSEDESCPKRRKLEIR